MTTANAALTSPLSERAAASETVEMAEENSLLILCDSSVRMRLSPAKRRSDVTNSLKIPSSLLLDREAGVLRHTALAQQTSRDSFTGKVGNNAIRHPSFMQLSLSFLSTSLSVSLTSPPRPQTNKAVPTAAEPVEPRAGAKGNASQQSTHRTQGRERVSQALERVRQAAQRKKEKFTHISIDSLRMAFLAVKRDAARHRPIRARQVRRPAALCEHAGAVLARR